MGFRASIPFLAETPASGTDAGTPAGAAPPATLPPATFTDQPRCRYAGCDRPQGGNYLALCDGHYEEWQDAWADLGRGFLDVEDAA